MLTKDDAKAVALVVLIAVMLAVAATLVLMHVFAPAIDAGIVVGGM